MIPCRGDTHRRAATPGYFWPRFNARRFSARRRRDTSNLYTNAGEARVASGRSPHKMASSSREVRGRSITCCAYFTSDRRRWGVSKMRLLRHSDDIFAAWATMKWAIYEFIYRATFCCAALFYISSLILARNHDGESGECYDVGRVIFVVMSRFTISRRRLRPRELAASISEMGQRIPALVIACNYTGRPFNAIPYSRSAVMLTATILSPVL